MSLSLSQSDRGRAAYIARKLNTLLHDLKLRSTSRNRERALIEVFRAKADVLLDVEGRYPFTDRKLSALTRKAETQTADPATDPRTVSQAADPAIPIRLADKLAAIISRTFERK